MSDEQVVVRLMQDWYEYRKGEVIVVSRGQAELLKCEILDTWENWKRRASERWKKMSKRKIAMSYIYYCPIKGDFVDVKDGCAKCEDFDDGKCPFYQEIELFKKPEIERISKRKIEWI